MADLAPTPMGGEGQSVQADETYYGNTSRRAKGYKKGFKNKASVVAMQPYEKRRQKRRWGSILLCGLTQANEAFALCG